MSYPNRNFNFSVPDPNSWRQKFKSLRYDPELSQIQQTLQRFNLWDDPEVQHIFELARLGSPSTQQRRKNTLLKLIEDYKTLAMIRNDSYMPYPTERQISGNHQGVRLLNQVYNNIPMYVPENTLLANTLVLGLPGGGKSSCVFNILSQFSKPFTVLDPKGSWKFRAPALRAESIESDCLAVDLEPPLKSISWEDWLFAVIDYFAQSTGLSYAIDPLMEAARIARDQQQELIARTGIYTSLCLKDIREALPLCSSQKSKRSNYIASAQAAMTLVIGPDHQMLFGTRGGIPLTTIFNGRYIISTRLLNSYQCRFLGAYILLYQQYAAKDSPETLDLKSLLVIDDAGRYINKPEGVFGSSPKTSMWMNLLSTQRSTGRGCIFIDQLVAPILDDIKLLSSNWMVIGGLRDIQNYREVGAAMNLDSAQQDVLGELKRQEAVVFYPSVYPRAVRGIIPTVSTF